LVNIGSTHKIAVAKLVELILKEFDAWKDWQGSRTAAGPTNITGT